MITLQDIFVFRQQGRDEKGRIIGSLTPTGIKPRFIEKLEEAGVTVPNDIFNR